MNTLELTEYFCQIDGFAFPECFEFELNLLPRALANELSEQFKFHPVIQHFHGLVLDDPDTSNHHILVRSGALEGQIVYLSHDGDSRVVFSSLQEFLDAAGEAKQSETPFPDLHPAVTPSAKNQEALSLEIASLVSQDQIDTALVAIPSMDLSDIELLSRLVPNEDFYLGEAIAIEIEKRPSRALLSVAQLCAEHRHPQVANAGLRAIKAIRP